MMIHVRDGIDYLLKSLSSCWSIVLNEYGAIISTLLAIGTFVTLFFFVYVLHCTLKSRTIQSRQRQQQQQQGSHNKSNEKHRRKKRKQNTRHQKHNSGRLKQTNDASEIKGTENVDVAIIHYNQTDPTDSDVIQNDDSAPPTLHTNSIQHDETIHYPLPPLAEDKPLDSPPSTGNLIGTTSLFSLQHYDSYQQSSPRSRTASTSTTDSVLISIDDQSSCSGRSTPTPIGANESSIHPSFVTTIINNSKQSSSNSDPIDNHVKCKLDTANSSTPNRSGTHNVRRPQTNRRSGKKNNHVIDSATAASESTIDSPPVHVPSKRWDALKPTNRIMNNRQQRYGSANTSKYHPGSAQVNITGQMDSTGTTVPTNNRRISSDERQPPIPSKDKLYTPKISTGVTEQPCDVLQNDLSNPLTSFLNPHVVLSDYEHQQQSGNSLNNNSANLCTNPTPNHSYQSFVMNDEIPPPIAGLNPNSPSWSGFRSHNTNLPVHQQHRHYYTQSELTTHQGECMYNLDHFNNTGTSTNITSEYIQYLSEPIQSTSKLDMNQQNQFYGNFNHPKEPFGYNKSEPGDSLYTPCSDFNFLGTVNGCNSNEFDFGNNNGSDGSIVSIPPVDTTMISMSPMSIGSFYHRSPHHTHVRENPFENSDDDDDDDQIEAKLLELGGQMVGNILDF
jgi:hypothetical protein